MAKYIPNSIWGAQGRKGYIGDDPRYPGNQFDEEAELSEFEDEHSGLWKSTEAKQFFVDKVKKMIKKGS